MNFNQLLSLPQVIEITSLSKSSIYRRMRSGTFPRPLSLGSNRIAWRMIDLNSWEKSLQEVG